MRILLILFCFIYSASSLCQVPYIFTPGTPIKSNEVNSNFDDLEGKIQSLESETNVLSGRVSSVESSVVNLSGSDSTNSNSANRECQQGDPHIFDTSNYSQINETPGHLIPHSNTSYIVVEFPFVEFGTGEKYSIKYPIAEHLYPSLYTSHSLPTPTVAANCYVTILVNGFQTQVLIGESRNYAVGGKINSDTKLPEYNNLSVTLYVSATLHFQVGETKLYISFSKSQHEATLPFIHSYDFTDALDTTNLIHRQIMFDELHELINYVVITKL
jgi:hypothetical protein